ncbi:uncharacterized protein LOC135138056 isoform X2 [Zophobas morio]
MMCALYALKLTASDDVKDFEMTTNNKNFGAFNDIVIKVEFNDGRTCTFLFQLKHKEAAKPVRKTDLCAGKRDFDIEKHFKSLTEIVSEDTECILYTNSPVDFKSKTSVEIGESFEVDKCDFVEYKELFLNTACTEHNIFRVTKKSGDKHHRFYFFAGQDNFEQTEQDVQQMLWHLVQCDIYVSFAHFMKKWWSKNYVLNKDDVISTLTQLSLSPYIKSLSDKKKNPKTEYLAEAIMNFSTTIVEKTDEDIVEHIWSIEDISHNEITKVKEKFAVETIHRSKVLWYLNKVPLIVKIDDTNKTVIKAVMNLINRSVNQKKIIVVGSVTRSELTEREVFQDLSDLIKKYQKEAFLRNLLESFVISIQEKELICLEKFIGNNCELAKVFRVADLLKMSQTCLHVGKRQKLPNLHITSSVSTIFVKTTNIHSIYESQKNQTMVIINCDKTYVDELSQYKRFHCVEIDDYLQESHNESKDIVIASTKRRCTYDEFIHVCNKSNKLNVYLFQKFDDELSVLLLRQGNELSSYFIEEQTNVRQKDILLHYFDKPVNAICGPTGIGKSTLMKYLCNTCLESDWGSYVDLGKCNLLFSECPDFETMLNYFLRDGNSEEKTTEERIQTILCKHKRLNLYLDGLNEISFSCANIVLDFVKQASSRGISVWISSRDNLREMLSKRYNIVPIEIHGFSREQQKIYIQGKLGQKYAKAQIEKILAVIFTSVDFNNCQELLEIPILIQMITETFLGNDDAYKTMEEKNILVSTKIHHLLLKGKVTHALNKIVSKDILDQLDVISSAQLKQYEVSALNACLDVNDFRNIKLNLKKFKDFTNKIKSNGDKYGIIKTISANGDPIFEHRICAEYLTCVWLKKHKDKTLLQKVMFVERYKNLRVIFDLLLAENSPLHLSIISKNLDQFEKYKDKMNTKDRGGRTPMHIICTYGIEYPDNITRIHNREYSWYMTMVKVLVKECTSFDSKDDLLNYTCLDYCLEANCLYVLEAILENKLAHFNDIKEKIFKHYKRETLVYYAAQMGYPYLFCALILEKSSLINKKIGNQTLLATAINGTWNDCVTPPRKGNIDVVNILLKKIQDINTASDYYIGDTSILDMACKNCKYDMLEVLVENGVECSGGKTIWHQLATNKTKYNGAELELLERIPVDVNKKCNKGLTALHVSSKFCSMSVAEIVLKKGANLNITDEEGNSPLHFASESNEVNLDMIKMFLAKGINVNAQNKNGTTALQIACRNNDYELTELLLGSGASININDKHNKNVLHYASESKKNNRDIIKLLHEKNIGVNVQDKYGTTALQFACLEGVYENAKILLYFRASVNIKDENNNNALHYAIKSGRNNQDIIQLLIDNGIDLNTRNKNGTTALHLACLEGINANVQMLLDSGTLINIMDKDQNNALHYASESMNNNVHVMKLLIEKGIHVNDQNKYGTTALQIACLEGVYENAKILLDCGASINIANNANNNALHFASESKKDNRGVIKLLIEKGIDVNAQNENGKTALQFACLEGIYENAEMLLDFSASIGITDEDNNNALHYASSAENVNRSLIKLLIEKGININAQNKNGMTALQLARLEGIQENVQMLLNLGASGNRIDKVKKDTVHYALALQKANRDLLEAKKKKRGGSIF